MSLAWNITDSFNTSSRPHHWKTQRIRDLVNLTNGYPFSSDGFSATGETPLVRIRDLLASDFETYIIGTVPASSIIENGDIIVGMDGDFNVALWKRGTAALNQRLCRIRPKSGMDPRFIAYSLPAPLKIINDLTFSTTVKHLSSDDLLRERIAVPPLEEQRRISDFLDAELAKMDMLSKHLRRFDVDIIEREKALLHSTLNGSAATPGCELPEAWKWVPLAHLTDHVRPIMYGIVLPGPHSPGGVPIVKGGDVAANRLTLDDLNCTTHEIERKYARSRLKGGDLVVAIRGSVGEIARVPAELTGANLTQDAARISINDEVNPLWLESVLTSPIVSHQIQQKVTGATIKGINIWDLKRVLIPTPSRIDQDQLAQTISKELTLHESLRQKISKHAILLKERRGALITAAVTGQFDVSTASGRGVGV